MNSNRLVWGLSILNLTGFLGTIVVNGLANALPINNKTTGELSDLYPNLFVPAGLTFSIWGLIYLLLGIFVIYQLLPSVQRNSGQESFVRVVGLYFFVACLANIGWILAWHYERVALSLLLMLVLLGSLLATYISLGVGKAEATRGEKYLVHLPFSVYLGWISIATLANVTALLVHINWDTFGLGEQFWAVTVIIAGIAIALAVLFTRKDIYFCLVVDWALLGILIKRLSDTSVPDQGVVAAAIAGLVLVSGGILIQAVRRKVY